MLFQTLWLFFLTSLFFCPIESKSAPSAPLRCLASPIGQVEKRGEEAMASAHPFTQVIGLHQRYLSPADGPRSHFYPVSSTYARICIERFGPPGILLGFDRLLKENGEVWHYPLIEIDGQWIKCDVPPQRS